jgi:N-acetylneuraminic acid mutarotase
MKTLESITACFDKLTAKNHQHLVQKKSTFESAFASLRVLIALLLCAPAAFLMVSGTVLAVSRTQAATKVSHPASAGLTFAERVSYQRAIEEVYWRHRIWPKENLRPKPSLDEVMSNTQMEQKVEDYLRDSQALQDYSRTPIAPEQLQAEMERMARNTKQPEVLRELFQALGNDPFVIAECLARPVLTERLVADLSAYDKGQRFALLRAQAVGSKFSTTTLGTATYVLPEISIPDVCTGDTWAATNTTSVPEAREFHTAVWTGSEMIVWGGQGNLSRLNTGGTYNPSTDAWTATSTTNAPEVRAVHTAVWTGSEMIVWGGADGTILLNTGGRYNPSADTWTATSTFGAPAGREFHTAVWTGSEMIVWGGAADTIFLNTGGRYNPSADTWTATSTTNAPEARQLHTAVWTGSEMIVWGGADGSILLNTGGGYNPSADTWTATSTTNAPEARTVQTGVWTGSEMIVWGGFNGSSLLNTGGRYNPSTNIWTATSAFSAPEARELQTAVWTGSEMIVWGGFDFGSFLNTGGQYNPSADTWTATSTTGAVPEARLGQTAVWSGSEMIIWGGTSGALQSTGGRYCAPAGPTPTPTPTPTPHPAFFTGETALGGGFYYLQFANGTPFGYYSYLPARNFIYHLDLGFEYFFDANDANHGIYFYDFASGSFFYTSPSTFPDLYDFSLNAWLYYLPDVSNPGRYTHNPRWFFNFATRQWITL